MSACYGVVVEFASPVTDATIRPHSFDRKLLRAARSTLANGSYEVASSQAETVARALAGDPEEWLLAHGNGASFEFQDRSYLSYWESGGTKERVDRALEFATLARTRLEQAVTQ